MYVHLLVCYLNYKIHGATIKTLLPIVVPLTLTRVLNNRQKCWFLIWQQIDSLHGESDAA